MTNRDGTGRILAWERTTEVPDEYGILKMTIPIRDRRIGPPLNLEVEVNTNGFVESATRRAALFTRLTEKYSVANLPNIITNDSYRMK